MDRPQVPEAIIENGKIINARHLRLFWRDQHHKDAILRRAAFDSIREMERLRPTMPLPVVKPPSPQYQAIDQIKGQLLNLQNRLDKHLTIRKTIKKSPEYKGIEI